jgi:UDP-2,3-diacylglucosamine hydrolase
VLLGKEFEKACGCQLLDDPTVIDLYGQPTLISHGDYLCTDDVEYQEFRKMVRDPVWQQRFLAKDLDERETIARTYREISMANSAEKSLEIMDVNQQAVEQVLLEHEVTQMIHGHTHRPAIHEFTLENKKCKRIVLGDWYDQGSVLRCDKNGCELRGLPLASPSVQRSSAN